jgi:AcrR family transcriptional regulator
MGSRERRQRKRHRVRQTILAAARDLAATEGIGKVSMRQIANRIEYTAAAIYTYFPGKHAILIALAEESWRRLARHLDGVPEAADPLSRLRQRVWRFYTFATAYPADFTLLFIEHSVAGTEERYERFLRSTGARVEADVRTCIAQGDLPPAADSTAVLHLLSAGMLGAAMTRRAAEPPEAFAHQLLDVLLAGLRTVRLHPGAACASAAVASDGGTTSSSSRSRATSAGGNT